MNYKNWLYSEEIKDIKYYQNLILSKLDLESTGISQSVNVWQPEKLIRKLGELGEYKNLPEIRRKKIESQIMSKKGTIGDLINYMVS